MMTKLAEVLLAQPEERCTIEFRVAADVVVRVRVKRLALFVVPHLFGVVARIDVDRARVPVLLLARNVTAPLENQDALPGRRKLVRERPAAGAGSDDDDVVVCLARHDVLSNRS